MRPSLDVDPGTVAALAAAVIRRAIQDYRAGWQDADVPDAGAFLHALGLVQADGRLGRADLVIPQPLPKLPIPKRGKHATD